MVIINCSLLIHNNNLNVVGMDIESFIDVQYAGRVVPLVVQKEEVL
jgi:hypothetical protein